MSELVDATAIIRSGTDLPVIVDADTGFGGVLNVVRTVHELNDLGVACVCLEDKVFPRANSFADTQHDLLSTTEFCHRLLAARSCCAPELVIAARTEALIAGRPIDEAIKRCRAYASEGQAELIVVHSKARDPSQVLAFAARWDLDVPLAVIPTTFFTLTCQRAFSAGIQVIIYANQALRAEIAAVGHALAQVRINGCSAPIEESIATVDEVFALQNLPDWLKFGSNM
jgi:phosphoenolpyruvate phosphomutase